MNDSHSLDSLVPITEATLEKLEARVQEQLHGQVKDLQLTIHENGILLRGVARSYYAKQLAQHAVMQETTIPILANEIEVF